MLVQRAVAFRTPKFGGRKSDNRLLDQPANILHLFGHRHSRQQCVRILSDRVRHQRFASSRVNGPSLDWSRQPPTVKRRILLLVLLAPLVLWARPALADDPPVQDDVPTPADATRDELLKGAAATNIAAAQSGGRERVTPSGAFAYTVPIEVPKGLGGLGPSIALEYQSSSGNSLAGVGWSLAGLPAVIRDKARGVTPSAGGTDSFYFAEGGWGHPASPSARLVSDSTVVSRWRTVHWSPGRIFESSGSCGDGPCSWRMRDGKGNTYYFGQDSTTINQPVTALVLGTGSSVFWERSTPVGGGNRGVIAWLLSRVVDVNGNEYRVQYGTDPSFGDAPFPLRILYSLHTGALLGPSREVVFGYEARPDRMPVPTLYGMRLKTITIRAAGSDLHSYALDYETSQTSGRSRLVHVTKRGSDGTTALPPYTFHWQDSPQGTPTDFIPSPRTGVNWKPGKDYDTSVNAWLGRFPVMTGDINGDGRADLVVAFRGVGGWFVQSSLGQANGSFGPTQTLTDPSHPFDYSLYQSVRDQRQKYGDDVDWCEDIPLLGDVNGDGFDDLVFVYIGTSGITTLVAYGSTGGFSSPHQSPYLVDGKALDQTHGCWNNGIERPRWQVTLSDVNRDSVPDLILVHPNPAKPVAIQALGSPKGLSPFQVPGGGAITQLNVGDIKPLGTSGNLSLNQHFVAGDVDGDGVNDIVYVNAGPQSAILYWLGERTTGLYSFGQVPGDAITECEPKGWDCIRVFGGDFNGDGRLDVSAGNVILFGDPSPGANLKVWERPQKLPWGQPWATYPYQGADWNADGISDTNSGLGWIDGLVNGPPGPQAFFASGETCTRAANLNGDDGADCFFFAHTTDGTLLQMHWGTPQGVSGPVQLTDLSQAIDAWTNTSATGFAFADGLTADVDNDGRADVILDLASTDHDGRTFRVGLMQGDLPDLLSRIENGLGGNVSVTYSPASRGFDAIQPGYNTPGGWRTNTSPRPLVKTLQRFNGLNLVETTSYNYESGGFTPSLTGMDADDGFSSIEITDANTLEKTVTTFTWAGGEPRHVKDVIKYFGSGKLRRVETYQYSYQPPAGFQGVPGPSHIDVLEYEQGVLYRHTQQFLQYSPFGDQTQKRECVADASGSSPICVLTTTALMNDESTWYLGRVESIKKQIENGVILDWERRFYNAQEYLLQRRERLLCDEAQTCVCAPDEGCSGIIDGKPSSSRWVPVEQDRQYDPAGNLLFHRDALGHGTLFGFDYSQGAVEPTLTQRYVTSDGKPVTLSSARTFNLEGGETSETDENGNATSLTYDPLSRLTRRDFPDGGAETTLYLDFGNLAPADVSHSQRVIVVSAPGARGWPSATNLFGAWKQQSFDGWGVAYLIRSAGDDGKGVEETHDDRYISSSRIVQFSKPHFAGVQSTEQILVSYTDGRVSHINRLIGTTNTFLRTFDYFVDHVDVGDELGGKTTSYRDVRGRIVKIIDPLGQSTTYGVDDAGRVRIGVLPNGDNYAAHYDNWGRKRSGTETWTGTTLYVYDDVSNLLSTTDAAGRSWSSAYDEINRVMSRTAPEGVTTFHYDTCTGGLGRLCGTTAPDYSDSQTWDTRGRLATRQLIDVSTGQRLVVGYAHDSYGHLSQKTLPDGATVSYDYSDAGHLQAIRLGTRQLATFGDYTALGKVGFRSDASGLISLYSYDDTGLVEEANTLDANDRKVLDYRYGYDAAGNVLSIADQRGVYPNLPPSLAPKPDLDESQTFSYDALGRLKTALGPYGSRAYGFDALGVPTSFGGLNVVRSGTTLDGYITKTLTIRNPETGQIRKATLQVKQLEVVHDAAGYAVQRWTPDATSSFEWTSFGQLRRASRNGAVQLELRYDADGRRFRKVEYNGSTPVTTLSLDDFELRISGTASAVTDHISGPDVGLICALTTGQLVGPTTSSLAAGIGQALSGSTLFGLPMGEQYYYSNHLGSISLVTDGTGEPIARLRYEPFGAVAAPSRGYRATNHTFTGRVLDESTGLVDLGARLYMPELGRFLSPDDRLSQGPYDPRSFNRYAYAVNNPIKYVDPTGHDHVWYNEPWFKEKFPEVSKVMPYLHDAETATKNVTPTQWGVGAAFLATIVLSGGVTSIAGGPAVAGGTGAFAPGVVTGFAGLGLVGDKMINVTEEGFAIVEAHLAKFGPVEENGAMLERLRAAMEAGQKITGGDAVFYLHEIAEATQVAKLMQSGMAFDAAQKLAHAAALQQYQVSEFAVYPLEIIKLLPHAFNSRWTKFWEMLAQGGKGG